MGIIEQIMQMKSQGINDQQIIENLQQQGIPPKQIQDSINQANIKSAVSYAPQEMQPSIQEQEIPQAEEQNYSQEQYQQPYQQENYSQPEQYYPQEQYYPAQNQDSQSTIEIAEQTFNEKIKPIQKTINQLNEFKELTQIKLEHLEKQLDRIEKIVTQLQVSIIEKIGSYGQNINSIKKEMNMMQETFSNTLPKLVKK
jgi:hypothetical protein